MKLIEYHRQINKKIKLAFLYGTIAYIVLYADEPTHDLRDCTRTRVRLCVCVSIYIYIYIYICQTRLLFEFYIYLISSCNIFLISIYSQKHISS
jgi:hypothetical protein